MIKTKIPSAPFFDPLVGGILMIGIMIAAIFFSPATEPSKFNGLKVYDVQTEQVTVVRWPDADAYEGGEMIQIQDADGKRTTAVVIKPIKVGTELIDDMVEAPKEPTLIP